MFIGKVEKEVIIEILKGKKLESICFQVIDPVAPFFFRFANVNRYFPENYTVGKIIIQHYHYRIFGWVQIKCVKQGSSNSKGIQVFTGGKNKLKIGQRIPFIVILYGISKIQGIGSVFTKFFFQLYQQGLVF